MPRISEVVQVSIEKRVVEYHISVVSDWIWEHVCNKAGGLSK